MPNMPEPMRPAPMNMGDQRDIAFFDKVKKFLSNKQTMAEFLKLCNLFTQDLIDKNVLVHKVSNFIGHNAELMEHFKTMVNYSGDVVVENKPKAPLERVSLSNCRGLGPSYRLLPKRVRALFCFSFVETAIVGHDSMIVSDLFAQLSDNRIVSPL
jgi:paired amphipathic helix protein Sin3a